MHKILLYSVLSAVCLSGCKKHQNTAPTTTSYTSAGMNGTWLWLGPSASSDYGFPSDAFAQFAVAVLNNKSVLILGDTLQFRSIDTPSGAIIFYRNDGSYSFQINEEWLYYYPANNSMHYTKQESASYGGSYIDVSTSVYQPNSSIKDYVMNIAGTKALSGMGYDTLVTRNPNDSTYNVNVNMNFGIVNDSTITFDHDILNIGADTLHYKSTDNIAKTVTFQNFHYYSFFTSTLTYNYATGKIVFEQYSRKNYWRRYVILQ